MKRIYFAASDEGLYNFFDDVAEAVDRYERLFREVQLEEQVGFDYHFIIEHQGSTVGQCQSPMVYLSALAQRTSTIRLATMVFAVPFYNPMRLAMDTAMIDQLSRGRLEVGIGMGPNEYEFKPWNIPFSERREMFPEAIEVMKQAWTEGCVTFHGKYWNFDNAIALPRPHQKPHPPLWFAGRSRGSLEWAAANSCNLGLFLHPDDQIAEIFDEFRQLCREAGHDSTTRRRCPGPICSEPYMSRKPMSRPMKRSRLFCHMPIVGARADMRRYLVSGWKIRTKIHRYASNASRFTSD